MTTLNFKDVLDIPKWRPLSPSMAASLAGNSLINDCRNNIDNHCMVYNLRSAVALDAFDVKNDEWMLIGSPGLTGVFGAGAGGCFMASAGPRGVLAAGWTTTQGALTTALPAAVGANQLANRGDKIGFKIRIIGNGAGSSGRTEERYIISNTLGATPIITLDAPLTFTPVAGDGFEILSGRVYMLSAGVLAAGMWRHYDVATNSFSGNLATAGLTATIGTDSSFVAMDELYVPHNRLPGEGFFGNLTSTAIAASSITGHATGGDATVLANEYRNFQIRIVQDTTNRTAVGQRRIIASHTAGASPVYTLQAAWTVNPSVGAVYVIENPNYILRWGDASANTFTYAWMAIGGMVADTWNTTQFGARGGVTGAGVTSAQSFGIIPDVQKNARHSHIHSFRGAAGTVLDILDIAGGATGTWLNTAVHRGTATAFGAGTSGDYDGATNGGRYMYLNVNGLQRFLRYDLQNRVIEPWTFLRFVQGVAVVGKKMSGALFVDGATKTYLPITQQHTGSNMFQLIAQR